MPAPNIKAPESPRYYSQIPGRGPESKLHTNVGHAKSAVTHYFHPYSYNQATRTKELTGYRGPDMFIFEMNKDSGQWEVLYHITKGMIEVPWKAGETERKAAEEKSEAERKFKEVLQGIRKQAEEDWRKDFGDEYREEFERFLAGYTAGFLKAKKLYHIGSRVGSAQYGY